MLIAVLATVAISGCTQTISGPNSIFRPESDFASDLAGLFIFSIIIAAVVFASVHSAPLDETVTLAALQAVRLLAGAGFGWLFWKHGLEAAICSHFTYDMVLFHGIVMAL
ncbi:MAG: CPBP family intramembrane metalloprotease [Proteobacteria bacterium]|nr:CPBP family intramembrane metalloprotease [Pseudomonadota bacterium]